MKDECRASTAKLDAKTFMYVEPWRCGNKPMSELTLTASIKEAVTTKIEGLVTLKLYSHSATGVALSWRIAEVRDVTWVCSWDASSVRLE